MQIVGLLSEISTVDSSEIYYLRLLTRNEVEVPVEINHDLYIKLSELIRNDRVETNENATDALFSSPPDQHFDKEEVDDTAPFHNEEDQNVEPPFNSSLLEKLAEAARGKCVENIKQGGEMDFIEDSDSPFNKMPGKQL